MEVPPNQIHTREGACLFHEGKYCNMRYCNTEHFEIQEVNPDKLAKLEAQRFAWRAERMKSNRLVRLYQMAGYGPYANRVELCATKLDFATVGGKKVLKSANFCKLRLCPMCIARGALVRGRLLSKVMDAVQAEYKCQYIFLTLTIRNVTGDKLGDAIGQLTSAWNRLLQHKAIKRAFKGTFRAIEITRNNDPKSEWYGTYHPHIHAILAVEDEYFAKNSPLYLTHEELVARWRRVMRLDYDPTVNVKATYENGKKKGRKKAKMGDNEASRGAVLEAAKYATKDSDYISDKLTDDEAAQVVADYTKAVFHRRLVAFTGWLKEMAQRLQADDLDHVDLEQGEDGKIREDLVEMIETYYWHFGAGDYVLARRQINPLRVKREGEK